MRLTVLSYDLLIYQVSILDEKDVKMVPLVSEIKLVAERNDDLTFQLLRFVEYLYYVKHYKIKLISKLYLVMARCVLCIST